MSSTTIQSPTTEGKTIRSVPRKSTGNKRKAADAVEVVAPAAETVPAAAPKVVKPRASKKNPTAVAAAPAATQETTVTIAAETQEAPPKKKKAAAKKTKTEAIVADAPAAENAAAVQVATDAPADEGAAKVKKVRVPKVRPVFSEGYGDEAKPEAERLYTPEAWLTWKQETAARVERQTFPQWKAQKKSYFKMLKALSQQKKKKRATKKVDKFITSEIHKNRLLGFSQETFAPLNGVWLSSHGFENAIPASELDVADKTALPVGSLMAFSVYQAAVHHGFKPLGIVSETQKKDPISGEMKYTTVVEGERAYVGESLPFKNKLRSIFSVLPEDRVFYPEDAESETVEAEDADTTL